MRGAWGGLTRRNPSTRWGVKAVCTVPNQNGVPWVIVPFRDINWGKKKKPKRPGKILNRLRPDGYRGRGGEKGGGTKFTFARQKKIYKHRQG